MFFPNRLVDHVPLAPLTCLTLLVYSPTALRTTPVRRALGVPAPPPVKPIYIRCLPSSPSVSPPTHRFVVSSGPLNSTSSKVCPPKRCVPASPRLGARASPGPVARLGLLPGLLLPTPLPILAAPTSHLPPLKTRRQEPRRPRIVNAWTEEVEELPWSSTSSGGSPGVSRLPRAVMLPGLGRSHHLESSVVQDLEPATPAPSSSIIPPQPQGTPARVPTGQAGPKDSGPGPTPLCRGACPPRLPSL
ncbi:proline-rich receptor-like protein kinase PERK8 isoform X5 [Bubalus bubalis]|uniref:proline-rich receptor-like protein kinase PERK8 isoform X5 n=1 Tax=Bubalus bubalis TaxID=89462 RepID=UPI001D11860D|nr:proline-rich receptor-like protein kinase PERK8 isoform X5 [Bubalus bubalis]